MYPARAAKIFRPVIVTERVDDRDNYGVVDKRRPIMKPHAPDDVKTFFQRAVRIFGSKANTIASQLVIVVLLTIIVMIEIAVKATSHLD